MPKLSKRQQDELARQQREERVRAALHWTEQAEGPDVLPPTGWRELVTGYMFNAHYLRVDVACTGPASHSIGQTDKTTAQGSRRLYSTRLRTLRALRNAVEWECAERLEKIDRMIEEQTP